jgi:hypothetical protein
MGTVVEVANRHLNPAMCVEDSVGHELGNEEFDGSDVHIGCATRRAKRRASAGAVGSLGKVMGDSLR